MTLKRPDHNLPRGQRLLEVGMLALMQLCICLPIVQSLPEILPLGRSLKKAASMNPSIVAHYPATPGVLLLVLYHPNRLFVGTDSPLPRHNLPASHQISALLEEQSNHDGCHPASCDPWKETRHGNAPWTDAQHFHNGNILLFQFPQRLR
ncbi:hypothetical protein BKA70DRAFT_487220 [Coprinopsis sp. MPI-PUGE-AT-0042]|nr:hypothetical protein BKA70DRAFT_487220 [Coprinopsis sp. MPI-PUGE-AT-0042]